jgi:hypothetical protein
MSVEVPVPQKIWRAAVTIVLLLLTIQLTL